MSVTTWRLAYSTTLTEAATSVTISSLTGDTDVVYRLKIRVVADDQNTRIRPNNDTGENYGYQLLAGQDTASSASRATDEIGLVVNYAGGAAGSVYAGEMLIYAKSGYVRPVICESMDRVITTSVLRVNLWGQVWNNTADEITSLVVVAGGTNNLKVGTVIELWKPASWDAPTPPSTWTPRVYMFS